MSIEKICPECQKEFTHTKSHTKYCSNECGNLFNNRKTSLKFKNNSELRRKKAEYERERNKRVGRKRDRDPILWQKHLDQEKERYRLKHNIKSDDDLKCAPKGSGSLTKHGYRQITKHNHPNCNRRGTMFEHVFIMAEYLGRPLVKGENIHHKNGIRYDNRIENLELWSSSQPPGQRIEDKIQWCREFLNIYGFAVIKKET